MATVKVLPVEDEPLVRTMMAEVLCEEGFEVTEASDGDQAARLIDQAYDSTCCPLGQTPGSRALEVALNAVLPGAGHRR